MPPAARLGDPHTCPLHVGGVIGPPCCPTVLIGGQPAARMGDIAICGPPNAIAMGSPTVLIGNMMAARLGDPTAHGGVIVMGLPTVMIGIVGAGAPLDTGMGAVMSSMAKTAATPKPKDTPQSKSLEDAAKEGIPTVEKCPYADH